MINSIKSSVKLAAYNIGRFIGNNRTRRHIITKFTEKVGMVYLGSVNQHSDDHPVVRGFTVSQSHQDDHYSAGMVNDYNITLVDRSDTVWAPNGQIEVQNWTIMSFELRTKQDLPHFFIGARGHEPSFYSMFSKTFPTIHEIHLGTFENYAADFTSRFALYSRPNMAIQVEKLMPANESRVLGAHLWPLSVEQNEHVLYIYSYNQKITPNLLELMLRNGLWLASHLDRQAELI